jgi:DNA-binding transcriptional regulator/RsmH inhibitor MraZ
MQNFRQQFLEQVNQKSKVLPTLKEKVDKLKGVNVPAKYKERLLERQATLTKLVDEKEQELEESKEKYEGYINRLKELFRTGELALSNV